MTADHFHLGIIMLGWLIVYLSPQDKPGALGGWLVWYAVALSVKWWFS